MEDIGHVPKNVTAEGRDTFQQIPHLFYTSHTLIMSRFDTFLHLEMFLGRPPVWAIEQHSASCCDAARGGSLSFL